MTASTQTATQVLAAGGILRPAEVVAAAQRAGLELASAATMLEMESGGGRNVWGHDDVDTGGIYTKGSPVTRDAYLRYKARRDVLGAQGVGPCQLTYPPLQDQADALAGCWDWSSNVRVGFRHLAELIRAYGDRQGFRRYNGSGPAAENYGRHAVALLGDWRIRLAAP